MMRHARLAVGLVMAVGASGCALALATPPRISVSAVALRGAGLLDQSLEVTLCAYNPNRQAFAFRRVTVGIDVGGAPLAAGASESSVVLPPHQSVLVPFAVTTTIRNLGSQLAAMLTAGKIAYRLHGEVQLAGTLDLTVPFRRSGLLDILAAGQSLLEDQAIPAEPGCSGAS